MKTEQKKTVVKANPWGHIDNMDGCSYHYGIDQSSLTIKPPAGETLNNDSFRIGLNIGNQIAASDTAMKIVKKLSEYLAAGEDAIYFECLATEDDETTLADLVKKCIAESRGSKFITEGK